MLDILIFDNSQRAFRNFRGDAFNYLEKKDFSRHYVVAPSQEISKLRSVIHFFKVLLFNKYDSIILISIFAIIWTPFAVMRNRNVTILLPGLGRLFRSKRNKWHYYVLRLYIRFCVKITKNVIVLSESDRIKLDVNRSIHVFSSEGIDLDKYQITPNRKYIKNISFVGRPLRSKGFAEFLELITNLEDQNFKFHFYGDGFEDKELELKCHKLSLKYNNFIVHGYTNKKEIWEETDILFLPTNYGEGFPFVVLEALASGCYVYLKHGHWTTHLPIDKKIIYSQKNIDHLKVIKDSIKNVKTDESKEIQNYLKYNHDLYSIICHKWMEVLSNAK